MKKILFLIALIAVAFISLPVAAGASALAFFPIFSKPSMSVDELEKLTENFSSFNGEDYDQFSSYEGNAMMSIIDTSRVFTITITNTTAARSGKRIYLIPGLSYAVGRASVNGVLYDSGNIVDKDGTTLTGCTASGSPKTLEYLYSYLLTNPTLINMIKVSSGSTAAQCSTQLIYRELSPFNDLESKVIPLAQNQNENSYRDKIATVNLLQYNIIASPQSQLELPLYMAESDTTVIELYFAKTMNATAQLKQQIHAAVKAAPGITGGTSIPGATQLPTNPAQKRLL